MIIHCATWLFVYISSRNWTTRALEMAWAIKVWDALLLLGLLAWL